MKEVQEAPPKILVVDDLAENVTLLNRFLTPKGYLVESASDGAEALDKVAAAPPDLILLDLVLPKIDGFEVCQRLKGEPKTRHIPVIIITGMLDREANIKAVQAGADDFVMKPFDATLLLARIHTSLEAKRLQDQVIEYQRQLEGYNETLEKRIAERTAQLARTQQAAVFSLAKLAESRDTETGEHLERIRSYTRAVGEHMARSSAYREQVTDTFLEALYQSSPLHDIGKVGVPDRILLKPGKLTGPEWSVMKTHTTMGGDTLKAANLEAGHDAFLAMGQDIAFYHHERWDGTGYPMGLKGTEIPLAARIVALADVYDALCSKRPYKDPLPHEKSKAIILEGRGTHFDPEVISTFLEIEKDFIRIHEEMDDSGKQSRIEEITASLNEMESQS